MIKGRNGEIFVDTEINEANFPDINFRKFLLGQDYGRSGVISDFHMSCVRHIHISEKNITDLKGIELFQVLQSLFCEINHLKTLDVSKNLKLRDLYCYDNQLTKLDVSNNLKLRSLNCRRNFIAEKDLPPERDNSKVWLVYPQKEPDSES